MKFLRRPLAYLLILVMSLALLSGCSLFDKHNVSLVVWETSGVDTDWLKAAAESFSAERPGVKIEIKAVDYTKSAEAMLLDGPAGVGPDLFVTTGDSIGLLADAGIIEPVGNSAMIEQTLKNGAVSAASHNDTVYGYPLSIETCVLIYNREMITSPPETWDEVLALCEEYKNKGNGDYGFLMDDSSAYSMGLLGGPVFESNGRDVTATILLDSTAIDGATQLQKLSSAIAVKADDLDEGIIEALFTDERCACFISSSTRIRAFTDMPIGVSALPGFNSYSPTYAIANSRVMCVSSYSEHKEEAAEFAEYLISTEIQSLRFNMTGDYPSADINMGQFTQGIYEQLRYSYDIPNYGFMSRVWDVLDSSCALIWDGGDVVTLLTEADKEILSTVEEYRGSEV